MNNNKATVQKYIDSFNNSDYEQILSCIAEDIEWTVPSMYHLEGKDAFDEQLRGDTSPGSPTLNVTHMIEENNVVVAEGTMQSPTKDGGVMNAMFCDIYVLEDSKIKNMTSYLAEIKE